jgi:hypothetical protein
MSSVNGLGASNSLDAIAQQLLKVFDRNKDGQLSASEFTDIFREVLRSQPAVLSTPAAASGAKNVDHLAGFVPEKLATSQSIKYRFGRAAADFSLASVKDKASAEALLQSMRPAFEREGLQVLEISKDRIRVNYEGQPLWVDVIRGATSGTPAFQWLPDAT